MFDVHRARYVGRMARPDENEIASLAVLYEAERSDLSG